MATVASSGTTVQASDLTSVVQMAGAAAPALLPASEAAGARRRLLDVAVDAAARDAALDALTRSFAVVGVGHCGTTAWCQRLPTSCLA